MLVFAHIEREFAKHTDEATHEQRELLSRECDDLLIWGERHSYDIAVPDRKVVTLSRVFDFDSGPCEVSIERVVWPLCDENREFLPELDRRIVQSYRALKVAGLKRPSIVLNCAYYRNMVTVDRGEKYVEKPKSWAAVYIVHQRLETTCRLAVRFERPEEFGPRITEKKDGSILVEYTKEAWRPALVRRGVVQKKKTGGRDAGRRSTVGGGKMRQVSGAVSDKENRRQGKGSGGKGSDGVDGKVRGGKRRKGSRRVQRDLHTLPFAFADAGEKDGSS